MKMAITNNSIGANDTHFGHSGNAPIEVICNYVIVCNELKLPVTFIPKASTQNI
jgi:hypothetical protein